ncbi:MAG: 3-phosphoserine/phosphohydroxythreonine transaminase [Leptospira sp.]|nr:3-phosphoserine/phosphohydroxythreonine transaminase [Leptospira sp.]
MSKSSFPIYNFNAGPAMLPKEVMEMAQSEFLDYKGSGMSLMEMSHRSPEFDQILEQAIADLKELLDIPNDYSVVFFPGGATLQFSAVALNLLDETESADYSLTGVWSVKAYQEAKRFAPNVKIVFDGKDKNYHSIQELKDSDLNPGSKFLYITSNNTIYGSRYPAFPQVSLPIVADMTSDILSRKLDISRFGAIFAGAQKNIGPSGLTVLIVRNSLLRENSRTIPTLLNWKLMAENNSLYNTPPTYPIYLAGLVFSWLKKKGGIAVMERENEAKAKLLYDFLDASEAYTVPVPKPIRSIMNAVFHLKNQEWENEFVKLSEARGLIGLKGHRSAGGFRASIYNAMPKAGVEALIEFLIDFEKSKLG